MDNSTVVAVGGAIKDLGDWIQANRGDLGENTGGDLRGVAAHIRGVGDYFFAHSRLPKDWEEYRQG